MTDRRARGAKLCRIVGVVVVGAALPGGWTQATDIWGVMPAALDQPQINATIYYSVPGSDPLYADYGFNARAFNVQAFFDTGASGILLSNNTAEALGTRNSVGIEKATYDSKPIVFQDVGVVGADNFGVSVPIQIKIAPFSNIANPQIAEAEERFADSNPPSFQGVDLSAYRHTSGPLRAQVGPLNTGNPNEPNDNPILGDLDVFGMPLMRGKVVVMDPKPVENVINGNLENGYQMQTHVYNPGTPFDPTKPDDPGIPRTTRTIKLSYGSFDKFTRTGTLEGYTPDGKPIVANLPADQVANYQPTLEHNPFIGPNPINPAGDPTPPVKVSFGGYSGTGSFLLDTGAAASMISTKVAEQIHVRYVEGTEGSDNPRLETYNPANPRVAGTPIADQFQLSIGGVGGDPVKVAGFFLDSMLVKTTQGSAAVDSDPRHLNFREAPVLVTDVTLRDPTTNTPFTIDGIFGMNNLVASLFLTEDPAGGVPGFGALTPAAFDWVVFDEPSGELRLRPRLSGDANRDGIVGFPDLLALANNYGKDVSSETWAKGDFNGDGKVNFADLLSLAKNYNNPEAFDSVIDLPHSDLDLGVGSTPAGVPEPTAGLLLTGGALALARRRRRRN